MRAGERRPNLPGRPRWWAVRRGRWTGVTSQRPTFLFATDGLGLRGAEVLGDGGCRGDADWAVFEHEGAARVWLAAGPAEVLPEGDPVVWAVHVGARPGIYPDARQAERGAGRGGRVRAFSSPAWGARYAQTGVYGMGPGEQDVRPCYARPWRSPALGAASSRAHATVATEGGRWAVRLLPYGDVPAWGVRGAWEERANGPTTAALALANGLRELLDFLWGGEGEASGVLAPGDPVALHVVTNCRSWQAFARGDWRRLAYVREARERLGRLPVVVVHDPLDAACASLLKEK